MSAEELAMYEQAALVEQEQALDASPDPGYDLDDEIDLLFQDECERYYAATRL